jgi:hypothetical protein
MYKNSKVALAGGLLLFSGPAFADITPKQVWDNWRRMATDIGAVVEIGGVNNSATSLTLNDLTLSTDIDGNVWRVEIPQLSFQQIDDGRVSAVWSDSIQLLYGQDADFVGRDSMEMRLGYVGGSMTVGGTPSEMSHDSNFDQITVNSVRFPSGDLPPADARFQLTLSNWSDLSTYSIGDTIDIVSQFRLGAANFDMTFTDPSAAEMSSIQLNVADVSGAMGSNNMDLLADQAAGMSDDEILHALLNDISIRAQLDFGATTGSFAVYDSDADPHTGSVSFDSFGYGVDLGSGRLSGGTYFSNFALLLNIPDMPDVYPHELQSFTLNYSVPITSTGQAQAFSGELRFGGLSLGQDLWDMIDQNRGLMRAPMSFGVTLSGTGQVPEDMIDNDTAPLLESLQITDLSAEIEGATLLSNGAFTFDNNDLETFDGMPRPAGEISFSLQGGNRLLDTLVATGILPRDQEFFARMIYGAITQPVGDDAVTTVITITPEGQFLANGVPLPF